MHRSLLNLWPRANVRRADGRAGWNKRLGRRENGRSGTLLCGRLGFIISEFSTHVQDDLQKNKFRALSRFRCRFFARPTHGPENKLQAAEGGLEMVCGPVPRSRGAKVSKNVPGRSTDPGEMMFCNPEQFGSAPCRHAWTVSSKCTSTTSRAWIGVRCSWVRSKPVRAAQQLHFTRLIVARFVNMRDACGCHTMSQTRLGVASDQRQTPGKNCAQRGRCQDPRTSNS